MVELYSIKYKLTKSNHLEAFKYNKNRILSNSRWRFINSVLGYFLAFALVSAIICLVSFYEKHSNSDLTDLNLGLISLILSVITLFIISLFSAKIINSSFFRENSYYLDDYILTLTDKFVNIKVRDNDYYYSLMDKLIVEENSNLIFLFFDNGIYIYVPQNAFSTDEAKKVFLDSVKTVN